MEHIATVAEKGFNTSRMDGLRTHSVISHATEVLSVVAMTSLPSMKVSTATSIRHVTIETVTHVILFLK